jgi:putative oxidoreductase
MLLGRFTPQLFAILRIITGLMFAMHGAQKVLGWPPMPAGMGGGKLPPLMIAAGVIELVCGLMIAIGFLADWAAFIASGEMAAAFFIGHASKGVLNPVVNQGELAVVYCFLFLFIAGHGAWIWSVDGAMGRGRRVS